MGRGACRCAAIAAACALFAFASCKTSDVSSNSNTQNTYLTQVVGASGGTIAGPDGATLTTISAQQGGVTGHANLSVQ
jgi:hypothetical protein